MHILAIETTGAFASVALMQDDRIIAHIRGNDRFSHLQNLMPQVDAVIKESKLSLGDVNGIAVSCGPGSFTGIRIGVSSARALSQVLGIPCIPISSLAALAMRAAELDPCKGAGRRGGNNAPFAEGDLPNGICESPGSVRTGALAMAEDSPGGSCKGSERQRAEKRILSAVESSPSGSCKGLQRCGGGEGASFSVESSLDFYGLSGCTGKGWNRAASTQKAAKLPNDGNAAQDADGAGEGCRRLLVCPMLDARRNQVYAGGYFLQDGYPVEAIKAGPYLLEEFLSKTVGYHRILLLGDAPDRYGGEIRNLRPNGTQTTPESIRYQDAATVAKLGLKIFHEKGGLAYNDVKPDYMRLAEAERKLRERQKL